MSDKHRVRIDMVINLVNEILSYLVWLNEVWV